MYSCACWVFSCSFFQSEILCPQEPGHWKDTGAFLQGHTAVPLQNLSRGASTAWLTGPTDTWALELEVGTGAGAGTGTAAEDLIPRTSWGAVVRITGAVEGQGRGARSSTRIRSYHDCPIPLRYPSPTAGAALTPLRPVTERTVHWTRGVATFLHFAALATTGGRPRASFGTGAIPPPVAPTACNGAGAPVGPGSIRWAQQVRAGEGPVHTGAVVTAEAHGVSRLILRAGVRGGHSAATVRDGHALLILQEPAFWTATTCAALALQTLHMIPQVGTGAWTLVGAGIPESLPTVLTILSWAGCGVAALRLEAGPLAQFAVYRVVDMTPSGSEATAAGLPAGTPLSPLTPETQIITDVLIGAEPLLRLLPGTLRGISAPRESGLNTETQAMSLLNREERRGP